MVSNIDIPQVLLLVNVCCIKMHKQSVTYKNIKIPVGFYADFSMLQLCHEFAFYGFSFVTALSQV